MEQSNAHQIPIKHSISAPDKKNPTDHGQDRPPPAAGEEEEENPETTREPKRRRTCPIVVDKQKSCLSSSFSFFCGGGASTPETTPKFGSFNLVEESMKIKGPNKAADEEEIEAIDVKRVVGLSELESTDGC